MESVVISAALILVILLLAVAVYDTNSTLQRMVAGAFGRVKKSKSAGEISPEQPEKTGLEQGTVQEAGMSQHFEQEEESQIRQEKPSLELPQPETLTGDTKQETEIEIKKQIALVFQAIGNRISGKIGKLFARGDSEEDIRRQQEHLMVLESISLLKKSVVELSERMAQTEANSDDFKDSIWSLRYSIDEMESQIIDQKSDQTEKTTQRVEYLESSVSALQASVGSLPAKISGAEARIGEIHERLQGIQSEVHNTIGYGIHESFECGSCGAEGYVATHVLCSKCGTESMWGWWPPQEESALETQDEAELDQQASDIMRMEEGVVQAQQPTGESDMEPGREAEESE